MKKVISLLLLILCSLLMMNFSSFTSIIKLVIFPGLLFGISITIPRLYPDFADNYKKLSMLFIYILLWVFSIGIMTVTQFLTYSIDDKVPYIITGTISGITLFTLFEIQFGFKNTTIGILSIIALSILACLIFDYYYPFPHEKELHIGKQILIWNILVGIGLTFNNKEN